jgi:hypothetical protein
MATPILIKTPALYIDEIRGYSPVGSLHLVNCVPGGQEVDVPISALVSLQLVGTVGIALEPDTIIEIVRGTSGTSEVVVDMGAGGVQAGWAGSATLRQSIGSAVLDELVVAVTPTLPFKSLEEITIRVRGQLVGGAAVLDEHYQFTCEDQTSPTISKVLWMTPVKAMVVFDEVVSLDTLFSVYGKGNVEVVTGHVRLRGESEQALSIDAGMVLGVRGSIESLNNWDDLITSTAGYGVDSGGYLDITPNRASLLVADDGIDRDELGQKTFQRQIRAVVSHVEITHRIDDEGAGGGAGSPETIQVAYVPLVKDLQFVVEEDLPEGVAAGQAVWLEVDEPMSLGRLYAINWNCSDANGNWGTTSISFEMPSFQVNLQGLDFTTPGIQSPKDLRQDIEEGEGSLYKICRILNDPILLVRYYAERMKYLEDPFGCPDEFLPFLLYDLGNPFRFALRTLRLGRLAALYFPDLMRRRPTPGSIEDFIFGVFGIPCRVVPFWTAQHWQLDDPVYSRLGHTTSLAPSSSWEKNCWVLELQLNVDAQTELDIIETCEWSDGWNMHFIGVIEPEDIAAGALLPGGGYWTLNTSALGSGTILSP